MNLVNFRAVFYWKENKLFFFFFFFLPPAATAVKGVAKDSGVLRDFAMNKIRIGIIIKASTSIVGIKCIFIFSKLLKIMSIIFSSLYNVQYLFILY